MVVKAQNQMKMMMVVMQVLVGVMLEVVLGQDWEGAGVRLAADVMVQVAEKLQQQEVMTPEQLC
jgi:hypothetical protein